MKKTYLMLLLLAGISLVNAQSPYTFSHSTTTYQDLTNATTLPDTVTWSFSFERVNIPLGFNFLFFDHTVSSLGLFTLDGSLSGPTDANAMQIAHAYHFNRQVAISTETSKLKYKTEGLAGNRICKIEMNNFGMSDGSSSDYVNLQIWLYEGSNAIEFRYGPSSIQNPAALFPDGGPFVYLNYEGNNADYYGCSLSNSPTNPTFSQIPTAAGLSSYPPNGMVYRFSYVANAIADLSRSISVQVYPNPAVDYVTIQAEELIETAEVYSLLGERVNLQQVNAKTAVVDIATLPASSYVLKLTGKDFTATRSLVKQ